MRHADKHKGFWRPGFTIPKELVDHIPIEFEFPKGKPLRGRRWVKGPSTGIRITAVGDEADFAQKLIDKFGDEVVEPAVQAARRAIDPAYQPVVAFDLRRAERYSFTAPIRTAGPFTNNRVLTVPANTAGLVAVGGGYHVLADAEPEPAKPNAMIDATPARELVVALSRAIADWKRWHGPWPDTDAGKKAEAKATRAKERPAESLFESAGTTNMAAITTEMMQMWVDGLPTEGRVAYDYIEAIKTLYKRIKKANRLGDLPNPAEGIELPRKRAHKARTEFDDPTADRIMHAALASDDDLIKWGTVIMAKLGMIISEFVYAPTSEIKQIHGVWCWHVGEKRKLKTGNRGRVMPIPQAMLDMDFLDYVRSRGDGLLFDIDNTRASIVLMDFLRGDDLGIEGDDQVNYSWRHRFISGLVNRGIDPTLRRYLDGHGLGAVDEKHYIHHHMPQMIEAVDPGRRMAA